MKVDELIERISKRKGRSITQNEIAMAWKLKTSAPVSNRISRGSEVTVSELIEACKYFEIPVESLLNEKDKVRDAREIVYYENKNLGDLVKHPDVTSVWKDRQVLHKRWQKREEDLRTIAMLGDSMEGGSRMIRNGDMLILDTTEQNIQRSGIYAYMTKEQDTIHVAHIMQYMSEIVFTHFNPIVGRRPKTKEQLDKLGFEVVGRVIHNDSEVW